MKLTTYEEFVALAQQGTFVPVCKEIMADLLTPVSAFLRIAEHSDYAFLLESVEGGEHVGRYSFLGKDPFLLLRGHHDRTTIEEAGVTTVVPGPFIDTLRRLMNQFQAPYVPGLPRLTGGAVGYFGYDTAQWFEPALPVTTAADDATEQAGFMLFDTVLAFDHVQHRILIIANARVSGNDDLRALYDFACTRIGFLQAELERALAVPTPVAHPPLTFSSNLTRDRFEDREEVLHVRDLLLADEDVRILEVADHALRVGHEVRAEVAAIELHAFDDVEDGLRGLRLFDRDDAFLATLSIASASF